MSDLKTLHDEDFAAWSKEQAEALRTAANVGSNLPLDWANLAEEIEDLGASQRSALHSQIRRIIQHFLKLEYSAAQEPRRGWGISINDARVEIDYLLEKNPSFRTDIGADIANEMRRAAQKAIYELEDYGELDKETIARIGATSYTVAQVLGDWLPPG